MSNVWRRHKNKSGAELDYYKGSKRDDWETPWDLFLELDREFHFTLDPCANEKNHKCEYWFGSNSPYYHDGLDISWKWRTVFMNPPYGREIVQWVRKAYHEAQQDNTIVVGLLPARTDTAWFHDYIYHKAEIRFLRGRVKFVGAKNSPPFGSMVVIWREGTIS